MPVRYTLYSYPDCASHVVRMVLEELGETYCDDIVDMSEGDHHGSAFQRLNPRGMVPVLADAQTGAVLSETGAILLYLAEQTGQLAPPPEAPEARSVYLQRLFFLSNTLHADAQLQYYTERYVGAELAEEARPVVHARMAKHFQMLDAAIGAKGPWLLGETLSVCDFYLAGCVRWALIAPRHAPLNRDAIAALPHLDALLARLEGRESVERAFAAEGTEPSAYFRTPVRSRHTQESHD